MNANVNASENVGYNGADARTSLVALAIQRLALGDEVAAAKYDSSLPISDSGREEELLSEVVAQSREIGLDPEASARFFRAQIEANKVVQRRLHDLWSTHPDLRPRRRPDLTEVRPQLDAITSEMLVRLKALESGAMTGVALTELLREPLDDLHFEALRIALAPVRGRISTDDKRN